MENRLQRLWQRGIWHARNENLEAAQACFESILARDPKHGPARFRLSMIAARRGRFEEAVAMAEQILVDDPNRPEVLAHLARCHLLAGDLDLSRQTAERALATPAQDAVVIDSLAVVFTQLGDLPRALNLFDQAIARQPDQASLHYNRAIAFRGDGQPEEAERDLEVCLTLNPLHSKAHWALAGLHRVTPEHNHLDRLRRLEQATAAANGTDELVSLALFKELDDLGKNDEAWAALTPILQRRRAAAGQGQHGTDTDALFGALIRHCDAAFLAPAALASQGQTPIFVIGMPRAGIALLGRQLGRHSQVRASGTRVGFARQLRRQLAISGMRPFDAAMVEASLGTDFAALGERCRDILAKESQGKAFVCESQPMDFLMAALIARALPEARFLHVVRDPLDTCLSILTQPGNEVLLPQQDAEAIASFHVGYQAWMQHLHPLISGRILDVHYESLVEKPEMVLRVVCAFLGLRYESSLREGPPLHKRRIGRSRAYAGPLAAAKKRLQSALAGP